MADLNKLYSHQCPSCGGNTTHPITLATSDPFNDLFNQYAQEVWDNRGKGTKVHKATQQQYATQFTQALMQGLGTSKPTAIDSPKATQAVKLKQNIYAFSSAKTIHQYKAMAAALTDQNGKWRSWAQFRNEAEKINTIYNQEWLKTEYHTAIARAEAANKWMNIQENKAILPNLRYKTMEDGLVRPIHQQLNNIVMPVDDPWWNTYYPPLAWNCRCTVVQEAHNAQNLPNPSKAIAAGKTANVQPLFKDNAGKSSTIFTNTHPYFKNSKEELKELDAVKNYGMPNWAATNQAAQKATPAPPTQSATQFNQWWTNKLKETNSPNQNLILTDKLGNQVLFDATPNRNKSVFFREHIVNRKHYDIAANFPEIIANPDEVWLSHKKIGNKDKVMVYIKKYKNQILTVYATETNGIIKAETCYIIKGESEFDNLRKGILCYSK